MNKIQQEIFEKLKKKGKVNFDLFEVIEICEDIVLKKLEQDREPIPSLERMIESFDNLQNAFDGKMRVASRTGHAAAEAIFFNKVRDMVKLKNSMKEALAWFNKFINKEEKA